MAFWGIAVKPGKMAPYVPPPECSRLHLSQVCLDDSEVKGEAKAVLSCKSQDDQEYRLCSLRAPINESASMDLVFDGYTEFSVKGTAPVHLTGYFFPEEEDAEEEENPNLSHQDALQQLLAQRYAQMEADGMDMDESDEDDDYDSDQEDASDEDDSDDELEPEPSVRIEELPNDEMQLASPVKQVNGFASLKEQAKAAAAHPAKPALKPSAAGDAAEAANAAAGSSQAGGADTLPVGAVAKDEVALKKRRASADPAEAVQKRAKSEMAAPSAAAAAAVPDSMAGLSKTQQKKLKKKLQKEGLPATAASTAPAAAAAPLAQEVPTGKQKVRKFENGFQIEDLVMGQPDGPLAKPGQKVFVKYRGTLMNGKCFDETKGKATFGFRLGTGEVIKGWDRGVVGMRVGDKRRLTVPPQMAYGSQGAPPDIPRNATLKFDVELLSVK
ncbi:hypothetical protein WJX84_000910 [Apatococcus fuscideae]|uniref:FK506-binding protein n=1 Tax=Apatococcus fuscideae TaxID=2026836 RepID=A0AAW1T6S6_9CHLO